MRSLVFFKQNLQTKICCEVVLVLLGKLASTGQYPYSTLRKP